MEESNASQFFKTLCFHSKIKDPKVAVTEWRYLYSYTENSHCICGMPIKENCLIENVHNKKVLTVGNVCINRFLNEDYSFIFKARKSLIENKTPNKSFITYCYEKGKINNYEQDFLINTFRKRKLSSKQIKFKNSLINKLQNLKI